MPWNADDAARHTKKANTPKKSKQWKAVANSVLARDGDEGSAIRQANAVIARTERRPPKSKTRKPLMAPMGLEHARRMK